MKTTDLHTTNGGNVVIYRAAEFTDTDPDPTYRDVSYYVTESAAKEAAEKLEVSVGSCAIVDRLSFNPGNLPEEFDPADIDNNEYFDERETIWWGDVNTGDDITGAVVIEWSWEKHVGYVRNLHNIGVAGGSEFSRLTTEDDLISGNEDRVFHPNYSVLLTKKEVEGADNLIDAVYKELSRDYWKWNHFKNNPDSENIRIRIEGL